MYILQSIANGGVIVTNYRAVFIQILLFSNQITYKYNLPKSAVIAAY